MARRVEIEAQLAQDDPDGVLIEALHVYVPGMGQPIVHDHPEGDCIGEHCPIHNPSDHPMRAFPTLWRADRGIMERVCPHGVGHPDPDQYDAMEHFMGPEEARAAFIHGCDGCCS